MAEAVGNLAIIFSGDAGPLMKTFGQVGAKLAESGPSLVTPLAAGFAGAGAAVGVAKLGGGLLELGKSSVKAGMDFETASIAMEVMTGSAATGAKLMNDLTKMAVATPFNSKELIDNAKLLKASGIETEQILSTLKALGDVAAGTDKPIEQIANAFAQVKAQGRLMGTELLQFSNAGVPLISNLAAVMNKPEQAIKGLVEEGQVSYPLVVAAFNRMTQSGGIFADMMQRLNGTARGQLNSLVEQFEVASRNVGLAFIKGFRLTDLLREWGDATAGMGRAAERLTPYFAKARVVFDQVRAAAAAVASVVGGRLAAAFESATGAKLDWKDFEKTSAVVVETLTVGFTTLIELIGQAGKKLSEDFLRPLAASLKGIGGEAPTGDVSTVGGFSSVVTRTLGGDIAGAGLGQFAKDHVLPDSVKNASTAARNLGAGIETLADKLAAADPGKGMSSTVGDVFRQKQEEYRRARAAPPPAAPGLNIGPMTPTPGLPKDVVDFAAKMGEEFRLGATSLERFNRELSLIDQAFKANLLTPQQKDFALNKAFGRQPPDVVAFALKSNAAMADGTTALERFNLTLGMASQAAAAGLFTAQQQDFALAQAADDLLRSVGDVARAIDVEVASLGSQEAARAINRAISDPAAPDRQQQIADALRVANQKAERVAQNTKETADALKRSGVVGKGF